MPIIDIGPSILLLLWSVCVRCGILLLYLCITTGLNGHVGIKDARWHNTAKRYSVEGSQELRTNGIAVDNDQVIPEQERRKLVRELAATSAGALVVCSSASMNPTIVVGQSVRVRAMPAANLRVGDVVVFEGKGIYMMHRVVLFSLDRSWFLHIGDAPTKDGPRRALTSAIVGRADRQRRWPSPWVYAQALRKLLRRW